MKFTIYGERCSGTNFLEELMIQNFSTKITWEFGWKHFFGFYDFKQDDNEDNTIFLGIIRDPVDWLYSFSKEMHHVPIENRFINFFLFNEFYSVDGNKMIENDVHYITRKKYKNIFELRECKNDYLMNIMPTKVKNYMLIRYEDLRDNTEMIMHEIKNKFYLSFSNFEFKNINYYKKDKSQKFIKKNVGFSKNLLCEIKQNLNIEQENKLNYFLTKEKIIHQMIQPVFIKKSFFLK